MLIPCDDVFTSLRSKPSARPTISSPVLALSKDRKGNTLRYLCSRSRHSPSPGYFEFASYLASVYFLKPSTRFFSRILSPPVSPFSDCGFATAIVVEAVRAAADVDGYFGKNLGVRKVVVSQLLPSE